MELQRTLTSVHWLENDAAEWRLRSAALQRVAARLLARESMLRRALELALCRESVAVRAASGPVDAGLREAVISCLALHVDGSLVTVSGVEPVSVGALQLEGVRPAVRHVLGDAEGESELLLRLPSGATLDEAQKRATARVAHWLAAQLDDAPDLSALVTMLDALGHLAPTVPPPDMDHLPELLDNPPDLETGVPAEDVERAGRGAGGLVAPAWAGGDAGSSDSPATVDLGRLCFQVARQLQEEAPERRVRWRIGSGMEVAWRNEPGLRQAVTALLHLAWGATRLQDEGEVEVSYRAAERRLCVSFNGVLRSTPLPGAQPADRADGLGELRVAVARLGGRLTSMPGPGSGTTLCLEL